MRLIRTEDTSDRIWSARYGNTAEPACHVRVRKSTVTPNRKYKEWNFTGKTFVNGETWKQAREYSCRVFLQSIPANRTSAKTFLEQPYEGTHGETPVFLFTSCAAIYGGYNVRRCFRWTVLCTTFNGRIMLTIPYPRFDLTHSFPTHAQDSTLSFRTFSYGNLPYSRNKDVHHWYNLPLNRWQKSHCVVKRQNKREKTANRIDWCINRDQHVCANTAPLPETTSI